MEDKHIWPGWEIVELIGKGGFGSVYKIRKEDEGGEFFSALKVVSIPHNRDEYQNYVYEGYDNDSIVTIFRNQVDDLVKEIKLMSNFRGMTNIVGYEDHMIVPEEDGMGWKILIRMELLTALMAHYANSIPDEKEIMKLGADICNALAMCEKLNIVHRDIKPHNIFINRFGDYKLGDFGVARSMDHTTHATKIGTYSYMAPEVYRGDPYNNTADIYSLGLTLYWLLNERRLPFVPMPPAVPTAAQNNEAANRRVNGEDLPAPKNGNDKLKKIVLKACAFNPEDRYKSAREMGEALTVAMFSLAQEEPVVAPPVDDMPEVDVDYLDRTVSLFSSARKGAVAASSFDNKPKMDKSYLDNTSMLSGSGEKEPVAVPLVDNKPNMNDIDLDGTVVMSGPVHKKNAAALPADSEIKKQHEVQKNMFCGNCGNKITAQTRFCSKCGHPVGEPFKVAPVQNSSGTFILTINRANQWYAINPPYNVVVDGNSEYKLENGSTLNIPISAGAHNIVFSCMLRTKRVNINVNSDFTINVKWNRITGAIDVE